MPDKKQQSEEKQQFEAAPDKKQQSEDAGQAEVQEKMDEATEKGYIGVEVDTTPNERYSQESDDFRTPESDPKEAEKVGSTKYVHVEVGEKA